MKLALIRHGRTEANEKHLYCGSTDIGLSPRGIRELEEIRGLIMLPGFQDMRILTSGMKRTEETLFLLFGDVPHETDADCREMDFGAFEMRSYEEMKDDPAYIAWISGDNEANITPGGESGNEMTARVLRGLRRIEAEGKDTLLVTHGGVIAALMAKLFPEAGKNRYEWQPPYGAGYLVDLDARTCRRIPEEQ